MERQVEEIPEGAALKGDEPPEAIGAYLSRQRRLRGISLEELQVRTQIPLRSLERLEDGTYDQNPDGFVRGLVRTVADALGLDPAETVTRMLHEPDPSSDRAVVVGNFSWVGISVLVGVLLALGCAAWLLLGAEQTPVTSQESSSEVLYRKDAVRNLAKQVEGDSSVNAGEER